MCIIHVFFIDANKIKDNWIIYAVNVQNSSYEVQLLSWSSPVKEYDVRIVAECYVYWLYNATRRVSIWPFVLSFTCFERLHSSRTYDIHAKVSKRSLRCWIKTPEKNRDFICNKWSNFDEEEREFIQKRRLSYVDFTFCYWEILLWNK